jgi:hypothetical protein
MTPEEILKKENCYFEDQLINGIPCSIGYIKKFKWTWLATQLNAFVIIGKTDEHIDKEMMQQFSTACFDYSLKNSKGWPRGFQAGIASIAILQGDNIDEDAITFCQRFSKKHWSAFEIPVLYQVEKKQAIRFIHKPIVGAIYYPFLIQTIDTIIRQLRK